MIKRLLFAIYILISYVYADNQTNVCPNLEFKSEKDILCPVGYQTIDFDYTTGVLTCQSNDAYFHTQAKSHICTYTNTLYNEYVKANTQDTYNKALANIQTLQSYQNSTNVQKKIKEKIESITPIPFNFTSLLSGALMLDDSKILVSSVNEQTTIFFKEFATNDYTPTQVLTQNIIATQRQNQDAINIRQATETFFSYMTDGLSFYVSSMIEFEDIFYNYVLLPICGTLFMYYAYNLFGNRKDNEGEKLTDIGKNTHSITFKIMSLIGAFMVFTIPLPTNLTINSGSKEDIQHIQPIMHTVVNFFINKSIDVGNDITKVISKNFTFYQASKFGLDDYTKYAKYAEIEGKNLAIKEVAKSHIDMCNNFFVFTNNQNPNYDISILDGFVMTKTNTTTYNGQNDWYKYYNIQFPEINKYTCSKFQNTYYKADSEAIMGNYAYNSSVENIKRASNNNSNFENTIVNMAYQNELYRQTFGFAYTPILPSLDMLMDLANVNAKFNQNETAVTKILEAKKVHSDFMAKDSEVNVKIYQHILSNTTDYAKEADKNWNDSEYLKWAKNKVSSSIAGTQEEQTNNILQSIDIFASLGKFAPSMLFGHDLYDFYDKFFDAIGNGDGGITGFFVGFLKRGIIANMTNFGTDIQNEFATGIGVQNDTFINVLTTTTNSAFKFVFASVMTYKTFYYILETVPLVLVMIVGYYYIIIFFKDVIVYKFASMIVAPMAIAMGDTKKMVEFMSKLMVLIATPVIIAFIIFLIMILKMLMDWVYLILVNISINQLFNLSSSYLIDNIDKYTMIGLALTKFGYNFFTTISYIISQVIFTITSLYLLKNGREQITDIIGIKSSSLMENSLTEVADKAQQNRIQ